MKVIVTGFNAFGGASLNPSGEAVMQLAANVKNENNGESADVAKLTLETCCTDGWERVKEEVEAIGNEPYAIVLTGVSGGIDKICLERFALNVRQYRIPDNKGHGWDEDYIQPDGPDALRTKLPLRDLLNNLNEQGFACDISNHAGTYVCNETYYRCLSSWQDNPQCRGVLFVHVPPYSSYFHTNPNARETRTPRELYTACLESIARFLLSLDK